MRHRVPMILSFVFAMAFMTIVCTVLWATLITDKLYHCTDATLPGYLKPGSWVHGNIACVREINVHDAMDKPDTIKDGWSEGALWPLWCVLFVASLAISARFAQRRPLHAPHAAG